MTYIVVSLFRGIANTKIGCFKHKQLPSESTEVPESVDSFTEKVSHPR